MSPSPSSLQQLRDALRGQMARWFGPLAGAVGRRGLSPNAITLGAFVLTVGVAALIAQGRLQLGGALLILTSLLDAADGLVARATGKSSVFGAFLDSSLDRYAEGVVFLGLFIHYTQTGSALDATLTMVALLGSLMVSYTKARAEGLDIECKEGLLTRLERLVILIAGLLLNQVRVALWLLAILANLTAVQRMFVVWQATEGRRGR